MTPNPAPTPAETLTILPESTPVLRFVHTSADWAEKRNNLATLPSDLILYRDCRPVRGGVVAVESAGSYVSCHSVVHECRTFVRYKAPTPGVSTPGLGFSMCFWGFGFFHCRSWVLREHC